MKITILNGNPDTQKKDFESYLDDLALALDDLGMEVTTITLREKDIHSCTGCWGCWVKTPGECVIPDDSIEIRNEIIHSDLLVFASPLIMGFTSALLKIMQDKLIPLVHPYIELVNNECHHIKRYKEYPKLALIYSPEPDTDTEDIQIVTHIYQRLAINFKSELVFSQSIETSAEKLVHEIIHHQR
ncbi:MAG: NAD(P)H-dependent oxidoreductase [Bacteroidetes bacterium]|nr:NAD(P)H-dependent oxidoreductase [Bacteroidota bacterium]